MHVSSPRDHDHDSEPTAPRPDIWEGERRILIVDDEPGILDSLSKIFKREGMDVLTAADGATGLDLLRKHRVSVLLTDLMMPRTTGMDLLKAAKTVAPE